MLDFTISEATNSIAYTSDNHSIDNSGKRVTVYNFINDLIVFTQEVNFGVYKIQTLENDSSFIYTDYNHNNNYFIFEINPFSESTVLPSESIEHEHGIIETINFSNTILNCNENSGLTLIELSEQTVNTILNEP